MDAKPGRKRLVKNREFIGCPSKNPQIPFCYDVGFKTTLEFDVSDRLGDNASLTHISYLLTHSLIHQGRPSDTHRQTSGLFRRKGHIYIVLMYFLTI